MHFSGGRSLSSTKHKNITELRRELATQLCLPQNLRAPEGLPSGISALDQFLLWKGFPKGSLSLIHGELGSGITSLWIEVAAQTLKQKKRVAWIDHEISLFPTPLYQRHLDLSHFLVIQDVTQRDTFLWVLQELMSSALFDLIGCDISSFHLHEHQLRKLQKSARLSQVALVFLTQKQPPSMSTQSLFSLMIQLNKTHLIIERALHRPTPHFLSRNFSYARFTHHSGHRYVTDSVFSHAIHSQHQSNSLSQSAAQTPTRRAAIPFASTLKSHFDHNDVKTLARFKRSGSSPTQEHIIST